MTRSSKANRVPLFTLEDLKIIGIAIAAVVILFGLAMFAAGCTTIPDGYDADTTPGHNGEAWVGGETPPPSVTTAKVNPCDINEGFGFHSCGEAGELLVTDTRSAKGSEYISKERYSALQRVLNFNCRVRRVIEEEIAAEATAGVATAEHTEFTEEVCRMLCQFSRGGSQTRSSVRVSLRGAAGEIDFIRDDMFSEVNDGEFLELIIVRRKD